MTSDSLRRIAFLDVDGTILAHGEVVADSTVAAIRAARANGHLVFLCTGRGDGDLHPSVRAIGFDGAVTSSGAFARVGDELIVHRPMPRADADLLIEVLEGHDLAFFLETDAHVYASDEIREHLAEFLQARSAERAADLARLGQEDAAPVHVPDYPPLDEADRDEIAKATFVSRDSTVFDLVQTALGERFHVVPGSMPLPGGSNGEISMPGTNKGSAIELVLAHLGIDAADAIGVGDSWNDVEMFQVCGTAVAMGEAPEELQLLAGRVTTGVLDDGVANAFRELGLI